MKCCYNASETVSGSRGRNENCRERFQLKHLPFSKESWSKQDMAFLESYLNSSLSFFCINFCLEIKISHCFTLYVPVCLLLDINRFYLFRPVSCSVPPKLSFPVIRCAMFYHFAICCYAQLLCCFGTCTRDILNTANKVKHWVIFSVRLIINSTLIIRVFVSTLYCLG